jgi:zinc transport system permease protein
VDRINVCLVALAGVTVAISMRVVGLLLVAALMALPVMTASRLARSLRAALVLSMAIGFGVAVAGLVAAYYLDLAAGGAIVLIAVGAYVAALIVGPRPGGRSATPI